MWKNSKPRTYMGEEGRVCLLGDKQNSLSSTSCEIVREWKTRVNRTGRKNQRPTIMGRGGGLESYKVRGAGKNRSSAPLWVEKEEIFFGDEPK